MVANGGRLLLILTSRDVQTAAELAQASGLSPAETLRQLQGLLDDGFIVVGDETAVRVYRLIPKGARIDAPDLHPHILLVEDDLMLRELVVGVLEDDGYAVIAATLPVDAAALLEHISFDLVITDGFSQVAGAVFTSTHEVLQNAGVTPVALFSAHTLKLEQAQEAGFRDLIPKPFDIDALLQQVRALLAVDSARPHQTRPQP
jgi:CheY-like chemotaxis protein